MNEQLLRVREDIGQHGSLYAVNGVFDPGVGWQKGIRLRCSNPPAYTAVKKIDRRRIARRLPLIVLNMFSTK